MQTSIENADVVWQDMLFANEGSEDAKDELNVEKFQLLAKFIRGVTPDFTYNHINLDTSISAYIKVNSTTSIGTTYARLVDLHCRPKHSTQSGGT